MRFVDPRPFAEGPTRPTGCPGRPMTDEERERVRSGKLNFFEGLFVAFE
jgi:hypothetical protein